MRPTRKAATREVTRASNYAAYRATERAKGRSDATTAPTLVLVSDLPPVDLEARQRALLRAMVKSASEATTWDGLQYLAELLAEAQGVQVLRSSDSKANAGV